MTVATLVTTVGSASANAYCSLAFADQFQDNRPPVGTTWAIASDAEKSAAILWATQLIDALFDWDGVAVDDVQALLWPRYGLTRRNGYEQLSDEIPIELQNATAEYARQLLAEDRAGDSDIETQGITSIKAGSIALTFKNSVWAKTVPDVVISLIPSSWYDSVVGQITGQVDLVRA